MLLGSSLRALATHLRKFQQHMAAAFQTKELLGEVKARLRRQNVSTSRGEQVSNSGDSAHVKKFNLSTYKLHALGDYATTIKTFGTTDSYIMQIVL